MTFTSLNFLLFFPVVVIIYNLIPKSWRMCFLLIASYFFYICLQPVYALLLAGVTLCTYFFARWIASTSSDKKKQGILVWSIVVTLLPLFFYKYFGSINNALGSLLDSSGVRLSLPKISLMLPVGISFYTFMAIGYLVDVYNETVDFENNIGSTALFLSFFPLVLSGPIERAGNLFPQFKDMNKSTYEDLTEGFKMMLWGYFMKLCVADRLGLYVDAVFNNIPHHNGTTLALASALYPIQVYADLGGYSLIAIGVARCLGIKVIPNFKRPFFSTSMSELWRRWHMSLIQWLTDYIYTPLSFAFRSWKIWGIVTALILTFLISGLWHGPQVTFLIWGLIQGVYLSIEAIFNNKRTSFEKKHNLLSKWWYVVICCLAVFVLFAFSQIFGKCKTLSDSFIVVSKLFTNPGKLFIDNQSLALGGTFLILMFIKDLCEELNIKVSFLGAKNNLVRYLSSALMIAVVILFGVLDGGQFIYFQF